MPETSRRVGMSTNKKSVFSSPLLSSKVKSDNVKFAELFFGYFVGPFGAMLAGGIFSSFLNKYWTEVLFAGQLTDSVNTFLTLLPLLSSILIIVGNLFAGQVIERTRSKAGKARPWILLSAVTVSVASVLMFVCPSDNPVVKMIMTAISYNLYYAVASPLYNTANSTMIPVSTRDAKQRSLLASASNMAGLAVMGAGSMVFPVLLGFLVTESTPIGQAHTLWLVLFACVAVITFVGNLLQYYFTRERVMEEGTSFSSQKKNLSVKQQVSAVVTDKYWWLIIVFYLLYQVSGGIKNLSMTYFTSKIVDNSFWGATLDANAAAGMTQTLLSIVGALPMAVAVVFVWPLSNKIGKQKLTIIGMLLGVVGGIVAGVWCDNVVAVAVGVALKCLGSAPAGYLMLAMISDVLDHLEAKNGFRCDGLTMSVYSSIMVASTPIGQAIFNAVSKSGTDNGGIVFGYVWVETVSYVLCSVVLVFFTVEKNLASEQELIKTRNADASESN